MTPFAHSILARSHPSDCPGGLRLRLIGPGDADLLGALFERLSPAGRRARFLAPVAQVSGTLLSRLSVVDQATHVGLLTVHRSYGRDEAVAEARYVVTQARSAEIALTVDERWQGRCLGRLLLALLERRAMRAGIGCLFGETLQGNEPMLALARRQGFRVTPGDARGVLTLTKDLVDHEGFPEARRSSAA